MTETATLERDGTTVTIPLLEGGSGAALVARDTGKPDVEIHSTGHEDPYFNDVWSGVQTFSIVGRFFRASAYSDAIALADMLKNHGQGSPITLGLSIDGYADDMSVVPAGNQQQAVSLTYPAGHTDWATVELSLTRVAEYQGSNSVPSDLLSSTPTASGTGPITLSDGSELVTFETDVDVERIVGRPNSTISRRPNQAFPTYIDKIKSAYDVFELELTYTEDSASTVRTLNDMLATPLVRDALTLDFGGLFGMGSFSVVPTGSQAGRDVAPSGHAGVRFVPTLSLRRVNPP